MPQVIPGTKLPFTSFPGIPEEASRRIWRDFEAVAAAITPGSASPFEAIIDPSLSASVPSAHTYINLADLVTNETWASTHVFSIGVKVSTSATITEPVHTTITPPGPFSITAFGNVSAAWAEVAGVGPRQRWDLNGSSITVTTATVWSIHILNANASFATNGFSGSLALHNCRVTANETGGAGMNQLCAGICTATYTAFSAVTFVASLYAFECHYFWSSNANLTVGAVGTDFIWDGGTLTAAGTGQMLFQSSRLYFRAACAIRVEEGITGSAFPFTTTANCAECEIDLNGTINGSNGVNLTVNCAASGNYTVKGNFYSAITVGSVGFLGTTNIDVVNGGAGIIDLSGPARINIAGLIPGSSTASNIILRGKGIAATIEIGGPTVSAGSALLSFVGMTDSVVVATGGGSVVPAGGKPYAFDAASTRNVLIFPGIGTHNWSTAGTDLGSHNRVISEDADTLLSSLALTTNHIFVGSAGAIATDVAMSGDATIVASGALTLAASGVTAGTYGSETLVPVVTFDAKGRATAATSAQVNGLELIYGEAVGNVTVVATTAATATTILALASGTYANRRYKFEFWAPDVVFTAAGEVALDLWDNSGPTDLGIIYLTRVANAGEASGGVYGVRYLTPAAGTRVYSIRGWNVLGGASNAVVEAGNSGAGVRFPMFMRVSLA